MIYTATVDIPKTLRDSIVAQLSVITAFNFVRVRFMNSTGTAGFNETQRLTVLRQLDATGPFKRSNYLASFVDLTREQAANVKTTLVNPIFGTTYRMVLADLTETQRLTIIKWLDGVENVIPPATGYSAQILTEGWAKVIGVPPGERLTCGIYTSSAVPNTTPASITISWKNPPEEIGTQPADPTLTSEEEEIISQNAVSTPTNALSAGRLFSTTFTIPITERVGTAVITGYIGSVVADSREVYIGTTA